MTSPRAKLRFLLPSMLGVFVFLTPVQWDGNLTIVIGIITSLVNSLMGDYGLHILMAVLVTTSVLTILGTIFHVGWLRKTRSTKDLFDVPVTWLLIRLAGTVLGLLYFFEAGPDILMSDRIGRAVFIDIGVNVLAVYVTACTLLPLLTDFGFMEFIGTLARPLFRSVFRLPGQSAIDALASVVGASSIGALITIRQYERSNYTARQACVIATNFSIVSIPFCLVVATVAGIPELFVPWYGVVVLACLVSVPILSRIPPLSRIPDDYVDGSADTRAHKDNRNETLIAEAWRRALERADKSPGLREFFAVGFTNTIFFMFALVAAAMALATVAAAITFHTPVFAWLGQPLVPLLDIAQVPDASAAAPGLFSGFLDQYMPAVTASGISSKTTSFVLAGLSVCQLIFMSELGVVLLRSSLPLQLADLLLIFLARTVVVLPLLIIGAHLVT